MSDFPQGQGWWQASDGKWYPPSGQASPSADPSLAGAAPPSGPPAHGAPPPAGAPPYGGPAPAGAPPYGPPPAGYPAYGAPPPRKSGGRTVWIVLAVVLGLIVLGCAGCVGLVYWGAEQAGTSLGELIDEATLDFTGAERADDPASCDVIGFQFDGSDDYLVEATLTNTSGVPSHYRVEYELLGPADDFLGSDEVIISNVDPDQTVRDSPLGVVAGTVAPEEVSCSVTEVLRIDA